MKFWPFGRKKQNLKLVYELGDASQMSPFTTHFAIGPKWAEAEVVKHRLFPRKARLDVAKRLMLRRLENAIQKLDKLLYSM